jgi:hypothetical protein
MYNLEPRTNGSFKIVRKDDESALLGLAYPCGEGFRVYTVKAGCEMPDRRIAVVSSVSDAIPALTTHLAHRSENWEQEGCTAYSKSTPYGMLHVAQDRDGRWWVYRGGRPLNRKCKTGKRTIKAVTFPTLAAAQEAADKYVNSWSALY